MTILVGQPAPDFTATAVINQEFKTLKLSDYLGQYVVLFFYPLDFTFVCPTEIIAFSHRHEEFKALDTEIIQTDRKQGGIGDINYPLISDLKKEISSTYNVLEPSAGVALRGLFIIDRSGIVQHITINNLSFGRSVDETIRVLKAIQYVQSHDNEVCPVDWQEGNKTMSPDPLQSKIYFASLEE